MAVVLPLLGFVAFLLYVITRDERARVEQRASSLALHISRIVDGELGKRIATLDGLAVSNALERGDLLTFLKEAQRAVGNEEVIILRDFGPQQYINTQHAWGAPLPSGISMSDRQIATLRAGLPYVGDVYTAPRSAEPRVVVARSVLVSGEMRVLGLTLPTRTILKVVVDNGEPDWVIGVGDAAGNYVTRSSRHDEVSGKPGLDTYLENAKGYSGTFYLDNVRGRPILAGYVKSPFSNWLYAANIDYAEVIAPQRLWLSWLAIMAAATLATSVLVAYYFGRKFSHEAARLAHRAAHIGEVKAEDDGQSDVAEFAVIDEALTRGHEAMAEREREREHSRGREAFLASIFDSTGLQVGIVELQANAPHMILANESATRLFGALLAPANSGDGQSLAAQNNGLLSMMQSAQQLQVPVEGEFHVEIDGRTHHFLGTFTRLESARIAFTCVDITSGQLARQLANARTRELEHVLSTVPAGVWFTYDVDANRVIRNRYAMELSRNGKMEVGNQPDSAANEGRIAFFRDGQALSADEMPLRHAMRGGLIQDREYELRFWDGTTRALLMSASPLRDETGNIAGAVAVALDITGRKRDEDQKQLLLNELNHRVKNTLATVQSVASQTLRTTTSKDTAQQVLTQRLIALAKAHDVLTSENWEGAYLHDIVDGALSPYAERTRFDVSGDYVWLTPGLSLTFSMALHELITNAIKYGALSTAAGRIAMHWNVSESDPPRLAFRWRESGGPAVSPPKRKGFGFRLLERSFSGAGGEVDIDYIATGLSCTISVELGSRARERVAPTPPGGIRHVGP